MKTNSASTEELTSGKSKKTFLLMLAAFALPIMLAKLALDYQWLNYGVTNKGTLFEQALTMQQLELVNPATDKHWLLLLTMPKDCLEHCRQSLQSVFNTYIALGKDKPRVKAVALSQSQLSEIQQKELSQEQWIFMPSTSLAQQVFREPQVVIVDPLGNLVLSHALPKESAELSFFGKQVLADMKKLLKYSKVG